MTSDAAPPAHPSTHYPAALYTAVHTGNPGDTQFYVDACADADPVLELGCGTGRIGGHLQHLGHEVFGLDHDPGAVALARTRGVNAIEADMRAFAIARRFARIIVPYNGLYCLLSEEDLVRCLSCARKHLKPSGMIIFDAYTGDLLGAEDGLPYPTGSMQQYPLEPVTVDGECWDVFEESYWDPRTQRADATYVHVSRQTGERIEATIAHRYFNSQQLPDVLARAGLAIVSLQGGFDAEPFEPDSEFLVVRAGRWR